MFAPLIILALARYPWDGIAIPLVPGIAIVVLNWAWNYFTFQRGARLITGATGSHVTPIEDVSPSVDPAPADNAGKPGRQ